MNLRQSIMKSFHEFGAIQYLLITLMLVMLSAGVTVSILAARISSPTHTCNVLRCENSTLTLRTREKGVTSNIPVGSCEGAPKIIKCYVKDAQIYLTKQTTTDTTLLLIGLVFVAVGVIISLMILIPCLTAVWKDLHKIEQALVEVNVISVSSEEVIIEEIDLEVIV